LSLTDAKSKLFNSEKIGVCIKSKTMEVMYQNETCKKLCGERKSQICKDGCIALYKNDNQVGCQIDSQHFNAKDIHGELCDIVLMHDGENLITFLLCLSEKHNAELSLFKKFGLTLRELEIVDLALKGFKNKEIAEKLYISRSTIKTHLNHIYQKIPEQILRLWRRT